MSTAIRLTLFERWLEGGQPQVPSFVYHRGELARDKCQDPNLAELADRVLRAAVGRWDVISRCGHVRSEIVGAGKVMLLTRKERGEVAYLAVRL